MTTGLVVLHPCPPLMRELLRSLLEPEFELALYGAWPESEGEAAMTARTRGTGDEVHVIVGGRDPDEAMALARDVPARAVVVIGGHGRWGVRVQHGVIVQILSDLSPLGLRALVRG